jgi:hypothetical protein
MNAGRLPVRPSLLADLVGELERGGAGRPKEIARRLGPDWTEDDVRAALAALFCDGVVGHTHEIGSWWVA